MRRASGIDARAARTGAERAAERLARDPRVRLVYLFGSAADDSVERVGDVDLAVLTEPPIGAGELLEIRADLQAELGVAGAGELELVSLNSASVTLGHQVAEHGSCLFAREPEDEIGFITRARSRYWDFAPFLEAQWELAGARLEARRHGPQA